MGEIRTTQAICNKIHKCLPIKGPPHPKQRTPESCLPHSHKCSHFQPRRSRFQVEKIQGQFRKTNCRIHLRNEFMRVGLIDVLDALEDDNSDELQTQLKVFGISDWTLIFSFSKCMAILTMATFRFSMSTKRKILTSLLKGRVWGFESAF